MLFKSSLIRVLLLLYTVLLLSACALHQDDDYSIDPKLAATTGNATLEQQENVSQLYANAPFVAKAKSGPN